MSTEPAPFNPYGLHAVHIPLGLLSHSGVSWGAKCLYGRLALFLGKPKKGRECFCNPSLERMASAMGTSIDTIERWLDELIGQKFIERTRRRRGPAECTLLAHPSLQDSAEMRNQTDTQDSASLRNQGKVKTPQKKAKTPQICGLDSANSRENSPQATETITTSRSEDIHLKHSSEDIHAKLTPASVSENAVGLQFARTENANGKQKPKRAWTVTDRTSVTKWLSAFMPGEHVPDKLVQYVLDFAEDREISLSKIREALDAAWKRNGKPGRKNAPQSWNWFYEVLRNAFVPGYRARLAEQPAVDGDDTMTPEQTEEFGFSAFDTLDDVELGPGEVPF